MENVMESFTDGLVSQTMPVGISWFETKTFGDLQYLSVNELGPENVMDTCTQGIFTGFSAVGAALIISLGIAAIIRIFRAA